MIKLQAIKDKFLDYGIKFTIWVSSLGAVGYLLALILKWILCNLFGVCIF